jgi:hypothetical protein
MLMTYHFSPFPPPLISGAALVSAGGALLPAGAFILIGIIVSSQRPKALLAGRIGAAFGFFLSALFSGKAR